MSEQTKEIVISNLKEIIKAVPNTYVAYVASTTLKVIQGEIQ